MTEPTNNDRARRGNNALSAWIAEAGDQGDMMTNMADLISDLMHVCIVREINYHEMIHRARQNYLAECAEHGMADRTAFDA